jgi:CheY-like chemotaxis protein
MNALRILYVDDDSEDREIFKEAISEISPHSICDLASDGKEGMQFLETDSTMPDYIFVDVNMPMMNGKQFLERVKAMPRLQGIPIVMYSTTSYALERQEYFRMGAMDVLVKPATFDEICRILKNVIEAPLLRTANE